MAAEHCRARSFEGTNWKAVIEAYETLERALHAAPTNSEKNLIRRRLAACARPA